jgi:hypothetical protein
LAAGDSLAAVVGASGAIRGTRLEDRNIDI